MGFKEVEENFAWWFLFFIFFVKLKLFIKSEYWSLELESFEMNKFFVIVYLDNGREN